MISAHGNSIRALCKNLFNLDNKQISNLEIPTGNPLFIELNEKSKISKFEYLDKDWGDILAAADLVVSRAGANIVYELLVLGKPNLLIPLSRKSSRGDQIENANYAKKNGYSSVILEEDLDPEYFVSKIYKTWARLAEFREHLTHFEAPNSVSIICEELHSYLQKN